MTNQNRRCSVCGGATGRNSSVCSQCAGVNTGFQKYLAIRSYMDVLMYPVAMFIVIGLLILGCWLVTLLEYL